MSHDLESLARLTRREHDEIFRAGISPTLEEIVGWEFCGWNCSLVPKLGGFQKFVKGFYRRADPPPRACEGFNILAIQNGLDGDWLGRPADDEPRRFGFYTVEPAPKDRSRVPTGGALLLDYGAHERNPRLDPSRLLRDFIVKVEGNPDLLLGSAYLALGLWVFAGYFLLRRRREHDYRG